jgi:uncharacterized protein
MSNETGSATVLERGATGVITHRVRAECQAEYDAWLHEIMPVCAGFPGWLDCQIIRPIAGLTTTYTVVIRFDSHAHLGAWLGSEERAALLAKARPLLASADDFYVSSGLDFWFTPQGAAAKVPVRWKQALVTWSAIYPLVLFVPLLVVPLLHRLGVPRNRYLETLGVSGVLVGLMVYAVMPHYTRLLQRWLFR